MKKAILSARHYIMLSYFQLKASPSRKAYCRLPYPCGGLRILRVIGLSVLEVKMLENEYRALRASEVLENSKRKSLMNQ